MKTQAKTQRQLLAENERLRAALTEAEETLRAIRSGEVDALVVSGTDGEQVFTLHGADRSYRALIEEMNEGALNLSSNGMILYANQKFADMLGTAPASLMGTPLQACVRPEYQAALEALLQDGAKDKCHAEVSLAAINGRSVPAYMSVAPVAVDGVHTFLGAVVMDLTEQKRAEQALRVSEAKFRIVFQNASLGKLLASMDGKFEVNNALLAMLGYSTEELQRLDWKGVIHPDDVQVVQNALKGLQEGRLAGARSEMRLIHKNGNIVWADVTLGLVKDPDGNPLYVLTSVYDISARKEADSALRDLKMHLQRYVEAERLHLAQDLHDIPLQELYGILFRLEELHSKSQPEEAEAIGEVITDVRSTLSSLRSIASELRPPTISRFGLEKAVRSYIQEFRDKHPDIMVKASLKRDAQTLPEDARLMLFRVLQEAFSNILRHAHATEIYVRFEFNATQVCLEVTDNGIGFAVPENWGGMVREGHYGLAGMAERISTVGGVLTVTSEPGLSTRVRAVLPYTPESGAAPKAHRPRKSSH